MQLFKAVKCPAQDDTWAHTVVTHSQVFPAPETSYTHIVLHKTIFVSKPELDAIP